MRETLAPSVWARVRGNASRAITIAALGLLAVEALLVLRFWWAYFEGFFRPVLAADMIGDLGFLASHQSPLAFVFSPHNEHVTVTTRTLSVVDFITSGLQYRLHQWAMLACLVVVAAALSGILLWERKSDAIGASLFVVVGLFAPLNMAVATMPYFTQHFTGTASALIVSLSMYALVVGRHCVWQRTACCVAFVIGSFCALGSGANGVVLIVSALTAPLLLHAPLGRRARFVQLLVACVTIMVWARWFTSGSSTAIENLLRVGNWPRVVEYYVRILALPVYYVVRGSRTAILFGLFSLVASLWAFYVSWRSPWQRSVALFVSASLLLGHHLSAVMVALGRSGTRWGAEDPKYYYYATVILVTTAAIFWANGTVDRARARRGALAALAVVGLVFVGGSGATLGGSRGLYKAFEAASLATAMGTTDVQTIALAVSRPEVAGLYRFAEAHRLNLFRWPLFLLLGTESTRLPLHAGCSGSVEVQRNLPAGDGGAVTYAAGWAVDPGRSGRRGLAIAVANGDGVIVGLGVFESVRPDLRARVGMAAVPATALLGWKAFVRSTSFEPRHALFVVDRGRLTACRFGEVDLAPPVATDSRAANDAFIRRVAAIPVPTWRDRLTLIQGR